MELLKKVVIKNFRSIVREEFSPSQLTVFVGKNDSGKSNFLRSLNLFFNNQTDPGQPVDFELDFSGHARVGRGKARQIEVWLDIQPPASFADQSLVRWRRAWREGGTTYAWQDFTRLKDGKRIEGRSKVLPWLSRLRYRYVPAIKGQEYFSALLRDVHDILAETVDAELRGASGSFIETIRDHTSQITELTKSAFGIESKLQLPTNLRALFEVLDFETSYGDRGQSLKQRGDGVKVRHISAILKFLSDQEKKLVGSGRTKPETIWGYEEPENNLEMAQAFEQAQELLTYSTGIQILLSTHSPAFYSLVDKNQAGVRGFNVIRDSEGTHLHEIDDNGVHDLNESMGLMRLVAPYVKEKADLLAEVSLQAEDLAQRLRASEALVVLVAGQTDAQYLGCALDSEIEDRKKKIVISHMGSVGGNGSNGAGDTNLLRFARELGRQSDISKNKVLVLLDCDVNSVPADDGRVFYRKIPFNSENDVFKKGIENLLPKSLALEEFYEITKKTDEYGATTTVSRLRKQSLCDAVCDHNSELPVPFAERMAAFSPIVEIIKQQI